MKLTEFGESLVVQLAGVRIGQRDAAKRVENVAGQLLHSLFKTLWDKEVTDRDKRRLTAETAKTLIKDYEVGLRRGMHTNEAARDAIVNEMKRLEQKFRPLGLTIDTEGT